MDKKKLNFKDTIVVSSMLFGMFFGAGNLIFPASLGISAGKNVLVASAGLLITAVGLPLLAVVALAASRCDGVVSLTQKVGKPYSYFFCTLLYLTIGPLFAIPRCASTSFAVGGSQLIGDLDYDLSLAVFSFVFFVLVFILSVRPGKIMDTIGKFLTPTFLIFLFALLVAALINPVDSIFTVTPSAAYATADDAFRSGFLEGYNTLDALAGLAFGMVVINVVKDLGVEDASENAKGTAKSGISSCIFMGLIYVVMTIAAARSASICKDCTNGGEVLSTMANYYFGNIGRFLMFIIVTMACLKTAVGLVTSCSEAFSNMFNKGKAYKIWAVTFCIVAFFIANLGLSTIVAYCVPILMFLYPLSMAIILLALFGNKFQNRKSVYVCTILFTLFAASFDFVATLASTLKGSGYLTPVLDEITVFGSWLLPFFDKGFGWICPSIIGLLLGLALSDSARNSHMGKPM